MTRACTLVCLIACAGAGCASTMPARYTVPVPVACIEPDQIPARPPLVLDLPGSKSGPRARALLIYQADAAPYISALEAIVSGCSTLGR